MFRSIRSLCGAGLSSRSALHVARRSRAIANRPHKLERGRCLHMSRARHGEKSLYSQEIDVADAEDGLADRRDVLDADMMMEGEEASYPDAVEEEQGEHSKAAAAKLKRRRDQQMKETALLEQLKPDDTQDVPHLPSPDLWRSLMPRQQGFLQSHRWFVSNPETSQKIAEALSKVSDDSAKPLTIVEGYPGPGIMSRAFLQQSSIEKVVALESTPFFLKGLQNLSADSISGESSSRLTMVQDSCYQWRTYSDMLEAGHLDHLPCVRDVRHSQPDYSQGYFNDDLWKQPSPLLFFAQLPLTVHSEQLFSQLLRAICHRLWLFRFGRVRLAFMCSEHMANRCFAELGTKGRGKVTHIVNALADVKVLLDADTFEPSAEHFYPGEMRVGPSLLTSAASGTIKTAKLPPSQSKEKQRQCLLLIEPKVTPRVQGDELDVFDYVTKNLFILRSQPIAEAMNALGAGADSVLRQLNKGMHPAIKDLGENISIAPTLTPPELTVEQMVALTRMFDRWPFRPQHLFDEGNYEDIGEGKLIM